MAHVTDSDLVVSEAVQIPLSEVEVKASRSSGPGGQHANKTETRVEATFAVHASDSLTEPQRTRLLEKLGPSIRSVSQDARSQSRNREIALLRLATRIEEALKVRRRRVATRPSGAAKAERVAQKRARGDLKATRRRPIDDG